MVPLTRALWPMSVLYLLWSMENSTAKVFSGLRNLPMRTFSCGLVNSRFSVDLIVSSRLGAKSVALAWCTVKSLPKPGCDTWMSDGAYCWRLNPHEKYQLPPSLMERSKLAWAASCAWVLAVLAVLAALAPGSGAATWPQPIDQGASKTMALSNIRCMGRDGIG
ncbi:MAG: hypothetical protein IPH37_12340 [Burkholderiales bacterium]|nr:hypothetical protein [Burkholderiales bacterium]